MPDAFAPQTDVPLAPRCAMGVGGRAAYFAAVGSLTQLQQACRWATQRDLSVTVLGRGCNVVIADTGIAGLVVQPTFATVERRPDGTGVRLRCGAGLSWDALVERAVADGLAGVECLSGIPGHVGAAPVQNIGAYGQELGQVLRAVQVVERRGGAVHWLDASELGLGYRTSHFKGRWAERFVIAQLEVALCPGGPGCTAYAQVQQALGDQPATAAAVRAAVLQLRAAKGMLWKPGVQHVGSFFMNPTVSPDAARRLQRCLGAALPQTELPLGLGVKLSAAWLIERAGYARGLRRGRVGLSPHHALCLENLGGASAAEILAFAAEVRAAVRELCGIDLAIEPSCIGFST